MEKDNQEIKYGKYYFIIISLLCVYYEVCIRFADQIALWFMKVLAILPICIICSIRFIQYFMKKKREAAYAINQETTQIALFLLLMGGVALRLFYVLSTSIYDRQHDVGKSGEEGHLGYITYLYRHHALPNFDIRGHYQFYHPPLHHIIAAIWYGWSRFIGMSKDNALSSIQVLTLFYSGCILIVCYQIFRELKLKGIPLLIACLLITFHPTLVYFSASINNDELSLLFVLLAMLYTIRWYKSPGLKNILIIAVAIGCGMMTKLSAGFIGIPVFVVFMWKLSQQRKLRSFLLMIRNFMLFGIMAIPLGLWFPLKNYYLYHIPLNYVLYMGPDSGQFIYDYNILPRFFDLSLYQFKDLTLQTIGTGTYLEHNIWVAFLKTSMFGEWDFIKLHAWTEWIGYSLFWVNVILVFIIMVSAVVYFVRLFVGTGQKQLSEQIPWIFLFLTILVYLILHGFFCIGYPAVCSQDARYVAVVIPATVPFLGDFFAYWIQKNIRVISIVVFGFVVLFSCLSIFMFLGIFLK